MTSRMKPHAGFMWLLMTAFLACDLPPEPSLDNPYDNGSDIIIFPPVNLRIQSGFYRSLTITWTPASKKTEAFLVDRAIADAPFERVDSTGVANVFYVDNTVRPEYSYRYRVRPLGGGVVGAHSPVLSVRYSAGLPNAMPPFPGLSGKVTDIALDYTGDYLAAADDSGTLRTWLVSGRFNLRTVSVNAAITAVRFAPAEDSFAFAAADSTIHFDDRSLISLPGMPTKLDWLSGEMIACGFSDGKVRIYGVTSKQLLQTLDAHGGAVTAVRTSPNGSMFATAGTDQTVKIWSQTSLNLLHTIPSVSTSSLSFTPDSKKLAVVDNAANTVRFYDTETYTETRTIPSANVQAFEVSADNFVCGGVGENGQWRLWERLGEREVALPSESRPPLSAITFAGSQAVIIAGENGYVQLSSLGSGWKPTNQ